MEPTSDRYWLRTGQRGYRLQLAGLTASLLLRAGPAGLRRLAAHELRVHGPVLSVSHWVAQGVDPRPAPARGGTWEHWARQEQVTACYEEGPANPTRYELRWRVLQGDLIELEASVATSLVPALRGFELFSLGQVAAGQLLLPVQRGAEIEWLDAAGESRRWVMVVRDERTSELVRDGRWPAAARAAVVGTYAVPLVVYRPVGLSWSYIELGHPLDVTRLIVERRGRRLRWSFGLFGLELEKGVILRTRLRAAVAPRADDLTHAERLARELAVSPPPLSA